MPIGNAGLSLTVKEHPGAHGGMLAGSLTLKGDLRVDADLHNGAQLHVTVADADGNMVSQALCEVGAPKFANLTLQGEVIGTERKHAATVEDSWVDDEARR